MTIGGGRRRKGGSENGPRTGGDVSAAASGEEQGSAKESWHLYEAVIGNSRVWLKLQASCSSADPAAMFEYRFTGAEYTPANGVRPITPFRLSECAHYVHNWQSVVDRLPAGWDHEEYQIIETAYPWCETLADDCDCHGTKGRLDVVHCSDFGLVGEKEKRARKTRNVRHENNVREMEERISKRDAQSREERRQRAQSREPAEPVGPLPVPRLVMSPGVSDPEEQAIAWLSRLAAQGLYCSIDGRHHAFSEQAVRGAARRVAATIRQLSSWEDPNRRAVESQIGGIAAHWLRVDQAKECAERSLWGDVEIPGILYKYVARERIGAGAPNSLRATQLLALNDDMECNVIAMKGGDGEALEFLRTVQAKVEEHLGVEVPWEELLTRWQRHADVRLSTYVQEYLNPLVGVVSFSTDVTVPTMWAHYARNTGIVIGYDRDALKALGFELRPVMYSEIAPVWDWERGDDIRLDFVNREDVERDLRAGRDRDGWPVLTSARLGKFGSDWKSLSRLLLVKGLSWAYEKEVRLLVDLSEARDTSVECGGYPVKVIEPPPEAIREIYGGANTAEEDVAQAVRVARGAVRKGLFVGSLSSHAFRIQKTGGTRH